MRKIITISCTLLMKSLSCRWIQEKTIDDGPAWLMTVPFVCWTILDYWSWRSCCRRRGESYSLDSGCSSSDREHTFDHDIKKGKEDSSSLSSLQEKLLLILRLVWFFFPTDILWKEFVSHLCLTNKYKREDSLSCTVALISSYKKHWAKKMIRSKKRAGHQMNLRDMKMMILRKHKKRRWGWRLQSMQ